MASDSGSKKCNFGMKIQIDQDTFSVNFNRSGTRLGYHHIILCQEFFQSLKLASFSRVTIFLSPILVHFSFFLWKSDACWAFFPRLQFLLRLCRKKEGTQDQLAKRNFQRPLYPKALLFVHSVSRITREYSVFLAFLSCFGSGNATHRVVIQCNKFSEKKSL